MRRISKLPNCERVGRVITHYENTLVFFRLCVRTKCIFFFSPFRSFYFCPLKTLDPAKDPASSLGQDRNETVAGCKWWREKQRKMGNKLRSRGVTFLPLDRAMIRSRYHRARSELKVLTLSQWTEALHGFWSPEMYLLTPNQDIGGRELTIQPIRFLFSTGASKGMQIDTFCSCFLLTNSVSTRMQTTNQLYFFALQWEPLYDGCYSLGCQLHSNFPNDFFFVFGLVITPSCFATLGVWVYWHNFFPSCRHR